MKVNNVKINKIFNSDHFYFIPVFQRNYAWKEKNIDDLFNTIEGNNNFIGSLVTKETDFDDSLFPWGARVKSLIDGQQRMTTMTLLNISASNTWINLIKKIKDKPEQTDSLYELKSFMERLYSIEKGVFKLRLKANENDQITFKSIVSKLINRFNELSAKLVSTKQKNLPYEDADQNNGSNVIKNYKYICEKFTSVKTVNELKLFIKKMDHLEVVEIQLSEEDDAQLIFESINNTGEELNGVDLIRNNLLLGLSDDEQKTLYYDYWKKIEAIGTPKVISDFFSVFLMSNMRKDVATEKTKLYSSFKEWKELYLNQNSDKHPDNFSMTKLILDKILSSSNIYMMLLDPNNVQDRNIRKELFRLENLQISMTHVYIYDLLNMYNEGIIVSSEITLCLSDLFKYMARRIWAGSPGGQVLKNLFINLSVEQIHQNESYSFTDRVRVVLATQKHERSKTLTDIEFENELKTKNAYKANTTKYLLSIIDEYERSVVKGKSEKVDYSEFTIEHIIPQTLNKDWDIDRNTHETILNRLGNLSLTIVNAESSNKADKKEEHVSKSILKINDYKVEHFQNEPVTSVEMRFERLMKTLNKILHLELFDPKYNCYIQKNENRSHNIPIIDLNPDEYKRPCNIHINGAKKAISSWVEIWVSVIEEILRTPDTEDSLLKFNLTSGNKVYFSTNNKNMWSPIKIGNIYVEKRMSAQSVIAYSKKVMDRFGIESIEIDLIDND